VLEGIELFEPPNFEEEDLLRILGSRKHHRIACQARLRPGDGVVRIRPVAVGPRRT
jgi:hypothetical protein